MIFIKLQKRNGTKEKHFSLKQKLDELKKLLLKKEQQIKKQDREFRHVMTKTIKLAAQVGTVYNWFLYKISNYLSKKN